MTKNKYKTAGGRADKEGELAGPDSGEKVGARGVESGAGSAEVMDNPSTIDIMKAKGQD